jgi:hypothetical protein
MNFVFDFVSSALALSRAFLAASLALLAANALSAINLTSFSFLWN